MSKLLEILKTFLLLIPIIVEAVKTVEAALPEKGVGQQKLAMVRGMMEEAFKSVSDISVTFEQVWPMIDNLIASIVAAFNAIGTFKKE